MQTANLFSDMFKQAPNQDQMFNWFKGFNHDQTNDISGIMQKNNETLMKASQVSKDNMQAIIQRSSEVMKQQLGDTIAASRNVMTAASPEQAMQRHQEFLKESALSVMNHSKEMIEMGAKSMMEVFDIFSQGLSKSANQAQEMNKHANHAINQAMNVTNTKHHVPEVMTVPNHNHKKK